MTGNSAWAEIGGIPITYRKKGGGNSWLASMATNLSIILPIFFLVYFRVFDFQSWSQVDDLWAFRFTPEAVSQHPHYYRYLVMYPGFLLSEWGGESFLRFYISLFMIVALILIRKTTAKFGYIACAISIAVYSCAHFFMNGRGVIAWSAWVVAIYIVHRSEQGGWKWRYLILAGFSLLCSSVSTGSFVVVYTMMLAMIMRNIFWEKSIVGVLALSIPVYYFSGFLGEAIDKLLIFFRVDGSWAIANMLHHGWGRLIERSRLFVFAITGLGMMFPFALHYLLKRFKVVDVMVLMIPAAGGAFGLTTFTLIIPSIIMVFSGKAIPKRRVIS